MPLACCSPTVKHKDHQHTKTAELRFKITNLSCRVVRLNSIHTSPSWLADYLVFQDENYLNLCSRDVLI